MAKSKKQWKPKKGEMIYVGDIAGERQERKFVCMDGDYYVCRIPYQSEYLRRWPRAYPIPKKAKAKKGGRQ